MELKIGEFLKKVFLIKKIFFYAINIGDNLNFSFSINIFYNKLDYNDL